MALASTQRPQVPTPSDFQALKELLQACDSTLGDCAKVKATQSQQIKDLNQQVDVVSKENAELKKSDAKLINNRFLWFMLGVGASALTVHLLQH